MKKKKPDGATTSKFFSRTAAVFLMTLMVGLNGMNVEAATLKSKTVEAWENYVQLTEERIARELDSGEGYFVVDFRSSEEVEDCREKLVAGEICVLKWRRRAPAERRRRSRPGWCTIGWVACLYPMSVWTSS